MRRWREGVKVDTPAYDEVPSCVVIAAIKRVVELRFPNMAVQLLSQAVIFLVLSLPKLQTRSHLAVELLKRRSCEGILDWRLLGEVANCRVTERTRRRRI